MLTAFAWMSLSCITHKVNNSLFTDVCRVAYQQVLNPMFDVLSWFVTNRVIMNVTWLTGVNDELISILPTLTRAPVALDVLHVA